MKQTEIISNPQSRREFVKSASLAAGSLIIPFVWTGCSTRPALSGKAADKLNVGSIGLGGQGSGIGNWAGGLGNMLACCDVDQLHADQFAAKYEGKCQIYGDYRRLLERKDIDVVTIGTPDHWHAAIAIAAMESGKDVYCEKPLTLTIDEGKKLCAVVRRTGRILQVGTQQRSDKRFLNAVALVRSGRLGKNLSATCYIGKAPRGGPFQTSVPPATLDWDFWMGQTPKVDFTSAKCHETFRWWLQYSGGKLTDWGAHHVDIAQWGLGLDHTGPVEIEGEGVFPNIPDNFDPVDFFAGNVQLANSYNAATAFRIILTFANGFKIKLEHAENGVEFRGENGNLFVNREQISGSIIDALTDRDQEWLVGERTKLYKGLPQHGHMQNFFQCVQERRQPVSDVHSHHRMLSSCQMGNIAMLLKRKLRWDPERELFVGDEQANALLSRPRRKGFELGA